jgi:hypothetical protein
VEGIDEIAIEAVVEIFAAVFLLLPPAALLLLFALLTTIAHREILLETSVREWFLVFCGRREVLRSPRRPQDDKNFYSG